MFSFLDSAQRWCTIARIDCGVLPMKSIASAWRLMVWTAVSLALPAALSSAACAQGRNPPAPAATGAAQQTNGRGAIGVACKPDTRGGCRVVRVTKDGPADRAGIRPDDVVMPPISGDAAGLFEQIAKHAAGDQVTFPGQRSASWDSCIWKGMAPPRIPRRLLTGTGNRLNRGLRQPKPISAICT